MDEGRTQSVRIQDGRNVWFTSSAGYACAVEKHSLRGIELLEAVIDRGGSGTVRSESHRTKSGAVV